MIAADISTEQIVGQAGQGAGNAGPAVASPVIYGILFFAAKNMAFLNRMAVTFGIIAVTLLLYVIFWQVTING